MRSECPLLPFALSLVLKALINAIGETKKKKDINIRSCQSKQLDICEGILFHFVLIYYDCYLLIYRTQGKKCLRNFFQGRTEHFENSGN